MCASAEDGQILIDPLCKSIARRAIHAGEAIPPVIAGELGEQAVVTGAAAAVLADAANFPLPLYIGDRRAQGRPTRVTALPEYPPSTQPTALPQKVE